MRKNLFRKALVFGIMLAFVTISTLPSVASNNYSAVNPMNLISAKDTQKNPNNDDNYEIIWAGNASVIFDRPVDIILDCGPDYEKNISIPGPDLYLIFLLGTTIKLEYYPIIPYPRWAMYTLFADIDDMVRADKTTMKIVEPGTRSNILGMGYLLENAHNKTVKVTMKISVYALIPFKYEYCERNVILHITALPSDPPSEATNGKAGVE